MNDTLADDDVIVASGDGKVTATFRNATGVDRLNDPSVRLGYAQRVVAHLGRSLGQYVSWDCRGYSLDGTVVTTLYKN